MYGRSWKTDTLNQFYISSYSYRTEIIAEFREQLYIVHCCQVDIDKYYYT